MKKRILLLSLIFIPCLNGNVAHAQLDLTQFSDTISVSMTPNYPEPHALVHLVAKSSSDADSSAVIWQVGSKVIGTGNSIDVIAGDLGSESTITASLKNVSGAAVQTSILIAPSELDFLYDAQSYTPPFYLGRSLPSPDTTIHVQAIARLKKGAVLIASNDIVYTWKQNGVVMRGISGLGKSTALLSGPSLFSTDTVSVSAVSRDGTRTASGMVHIPSVEPLLLLYPNHPLFGVMHYQGVISPFNSTDNEMTFTAVPYFANVDNANDSSLSYLWKIGNRTISVNTQHPNEITINAANSDGVAPLSLELTSARNFAVDSTQSWQLLFQPNGTIKNTSGSGSGSIFQTGVK